MSDNSATTAQVRWLHPNPGEVAINCDGLVVLAGGLALCGGVIRDEARNFLVGFLAKLGSCSVLGSSSRVMGNFTWLETWLE